jgi:general secretion pathway protein A
MYAPYFGLQRDPFSIAPDPHFLYLSESHREALAHLLYGLGGGGGFVLLTGEIGAGKTTVCRAFLEQIPATCKVAYIFNPRLSVPELLATVCEEFGVAVAAREGSAPSIKDHVDALNTFLLAQHAAGGQAVLIIDEAQALDAAVLEQLRLLTNLETRERKLLQIILIGQPELRELLARPELEQLAQRVIARYHLPALSAGETGPYVRHRLAVAGPAASVPFDASALAAVHRLTGGIPRRINLLCDRALLGAYAHGQRSIDRAGVEQAAREVFGGEAPRRTAQRQAPWMAALAAVLVLAVLLVVVWRPPERSGPPGAGATVAGTGVAQSDAAGSGASAGLRTGAGASSNGGGNGVRNDLASGGATGAGAAPAPAQGSAPGAATTASAAAPAAAPAPADNGPVALDVLLAAAHRDESAALGELAGLWRLRLLPAPGADPCAALAAAGLACYRSSGALAALRPLDRPALLVLRDAANRPVWVLLTALDGERATLQTGGRAWPMELAALGAAWRGEFTTLWRTPPGWAGGVGSPALQGWVAGQLAQLVSTGAAEGGGPTPSLREQVRAFQIVQGLSPDGIAGPMTLMRLNQAIGVAEPRLLP